MSVTQVEKTTTLHESRTTCMSQELSSHTGKGANSVPLSQVENAPKHTQSSPTDTHIDACL